MSPIIDVQRRLSEAGRIRAGEQVLTGTKRKDGKPATRPVKLQAWRFTSRNRCALEAVASLYGGEVKAWENAPTGDQWELYTSASEIDVVLPPESISFSQWMEEWSGGGCKHRCDTVFDEATSSPCSCDPDNPVCEPHTRLSTMLAGIPTTGLWRVETKGHYAKSELLGAMQMAELLTATTGRAVLPAKLRLEHRKVVRDGKTRQFVVPVLDFAVDMQALAAGVAPTSQLAAVPPPAALPPAPSSPVTPVPHQPAPSLAEQIASVEEVPTGPRRKNAPPLIPATGLAPRTAAEAEAGVVPSQVEQPSLSAVAPAETADEEEGVSTPPAAPSPRRRRRAAADTAQAEDAADAERKGCITASRARELVSLVEEFFPERDERLRAASNRLGRDVTTFAELTPKEGNTLSRWVNEMREF